MGIEVHQFICLEDNFGLLIHDPHTGAAASVDAPDGAAIADEATRLGWRLTHVLLTHHHLDHIQGTETLRQRFPGLCVIGAHKDSYRIPGLDLEVEDGGLIQFGAAQAHVIATPGHTLGHVAYYFADDAIVFVGDTLFSLGCGRLFEGTAEMMDASLARLSSLPPETQIYCGHEYTQSNARFARTVDPDNALLAERIKEVDQLRAAGDYTLPTTVALELATNPFLRTEDPLVQEALGMSNSDPIAVFAEMRARKNRFA